MMRCEQTCGPSHGWLGSDMVPQNDRDRLTDLTDFFMEQQTRIISGFARQGIERREEAFERGEWTGRDRLVLEEVRK